METDRDASHRLVSEDDALRRCEAHFRDVIETVANGVMYQDATGRIVDANAAALHILGLSLDEIRRRAAADPGWRAIRDDGSAYPAERYPWVMALSSGQSARAEMGLYNPVDESYRWVEVTAVPYFRPGDTAPAAIHTTLDDVPERRRADAERERLVQELEDALASLKILRGFIPICASCKKIRNDSGYWQQLEVYMRDHSEAQFSHGVCPDCVRHLYPEFADDAPPSS
ncbi:MAG: PAS domain-containing protein [Acidobacteriota bacterium]